MRRISKFPLVIVTFLASVGLLVFGPTIPAYAEDGGYPYANYAGPGTDASQWIWTDENGQWYSNKYRLAYRNCTDYVAWKLDAANGWYVGVSMGNAKDWKAWAEASSRKYPVDNTPAVGAVAWWGGHSWNGGFGHVAYVLSISTDNKKVTLGEYNYNLDGKYSTRTIAKESVDSYIHFKDLDNTTPTSGGGSTPETPQIFALKRTTDPNGVRQVYAGTNTAVTEGWWIPGGDGVHVHEIIRIEQHNIVGFDKVNLPGGTQALYAATSTGVWETWWKPDGSTGQGQIISGLSGVKGVIANNTTENGQFVHHLYILAGNGPYEAWWKDGGDGIHLSLLTSISGGVTFTMSMGPDGTLQLYVAVPTWVYEVWWHPGLNDIHVGTVINITQGDIRSLSKGDNLSDGGQLLYTGTSTTAWQSYWNTRTGISNGTIATSQVNAGPIKKTVTDGTHQLYLATGDHVQEYWWNSTGSGGGELIRIAQNNIGAIDKVNDGGAQDLYTGAGNWVYETWWGGGHSPSTSSLFSVAH